MSGSQANLAVAAAHDPGLAYHGPDLLDRANCALPQFRRPTDSPAHDDGM